MALLPLLSRAFFKAVVAPDGQTWLGDSTDIIAMAAFQGVYARSALVLSGGFRAYRIHWQFRNELFWRVCVAYIWKLDYTNDLP